MKLYQEDIKRNNISFTTNLKKLLEKIIFGTIKKLMMDVQRKYQIGLEIV